MPNLLTIPQAAERLNARTHELYDLLRSNHLDPAKCRKIHNGSTNHWTIAEDYLPQLQAILERKRGLMKTAMTKRASDGMPTPEEVEAGVRALQLAHGRPEAVYVVDRYEPSEDDPLVDVPGIDRQAVAYLRSASIGVETCGELLRARPERLMKAWGMSRGRLEKLVAVVRGYLGVENTNEVMR